MCITYDAGRQLHPADQTIKASDLVMGRLIERMEKEEGRSRKKGPRQLLVEVQYASIAMTPRRISEERVREVLRQQLFQMDLKGNVADQSGCDACGLSGRGDLIVNYYVVLVWCGDC